MPRPTIKTRRVRAGDIRKLREMIKALAAHHDDDALVENDHLSRDVLGAHPWVTVIVAEIEIAVVGYAAMLPLAKLQDGVRGLEIAHLYVDEAARRQGVGHALVEACEAIARSRHCATITLGTSAANVLAQQIYQRAGYEAAPVSGKRFRKSLPCG